MTGDIEARIVARLADQLDADRPSFAELVEQTRGQGVLVGIDVDHVAERFRRPDFTGNRASRRAQLSLYRRSIRG